MWEMPPRNNFFEHNFIHLYCLFFNKIEKRFGWQSWRYFGFCFIFFKNILLSFVGKAFFQLPGSRPRRACPSRAWRPPPCPGRGCRRSGRSRGRRTGPWSCSSGGFQRRRRRRGSSTRWTIDGRFCSCTMNNWRFFYEAVKSPISAHLATCALLPLYTLARSPMKASFSSCKILCFSIETKSNLGIFHNFLLKGERKLTSVIPKFFTKGGASVEVVVAAPSLLKTGKLPGSKGRSWKKVLLRGYPTCGHFEWKKSPLLAPLSS